MLPRFVRPAWLWASLALLSLGAVVIAVFAQYRWHMQPCPWCILQRIIFLAIGVLAGIGWVWRQPLVRRAISGLIGALSLAGIAAALYQYFVASHSASCDLTLADRIISGLKFDTTWPQVFEVRSSCAEAATKLAGIPFEWWSCALYGLLFLLSILLVYRAR